MTDMEVYMEGLDGAIDVDLDGIRGPRGYTGVGIASVVLNPDFTLTITLTDDSVYTTAPIRGEKGETWISEFDDNTGNKPTDLWGWSVYLPYVEERDVVYKSLEEMAAE